MSKANWSFRAWFGMVLWLAMKAEYCLEWDSEYWEPKWKAGLEPQAALDEFWKEFYP